MMPEIKTPPQALAERNSGSVHNHGNNHQNGNGRQWVKTGSSLGSIVAGGALAAYGVSRKSAGGAALAAAGSFLALRGIRRAARPAPVHVERSFTINRPVNEVFHFFRNFENLPSFMSHLKHVEQTGERNSHWIAHAPVGLELEWDAEITDEVENHYIAWQSLPGASIPNRGAVEFQPASQYHGGTEITVALDYAPPAGRSGALFARIFGREPAIQIREDLRRLKQLLEAGEIPTTEGQSHGKRSGFVRMVQAVNQSPKPRARTSEDWSQVERQHHPWAMSS